MAGRPAALVDRDGVINDTVPDPTAGGRRESPYVPEDVRLAPGAVEGLRALLDARLAVVVVSNQPSAAKGKTTKASLDAVHARVVELLAEQGIELEGWHYCFHHPDAVVPELRGPCDCRKPEPGLLLDAAREHGLDLAASWMIGDSDSDVEAGRRAGTRTILVEHPGSAHRRSGEADPTARAADLADAAQVLAGREVR